MDFTVYDYEKFSSNIKSNLNYYIFEKEKMNQRDFMDKYNTFIEKTFGKDQRSFTLKISQGNLSKILNTKKDSYKNSIPNLMQLFAFCKFLNIEFAEIFNDNYIIPSKVNDSVYFIKQKAKLLNSTLDKIFVSKEYYIYYLVTDDFRKFTTKKIQEALLTLNIDEKNENKLKATYVIQLSPHRKKTYYGDMNLDDTNSKSMFIHLIRENEQMLLSLYAPNISEGGRFIGGLAVVASIDSGDSKIPCMFKMLLSEKKIEHENNSDMQERIKTLLTLDDNNILIKEEEFNRISSLLTENLKMYLQKHITELNIIKFNKQNLISSFDPKFDCAEIELTEIFGMINELKKKSLSMDYISIRKIDNSFAYFLLESINRGDL